MTENWLSDLAFLVENSTPQELQRHEGDLIAKKHRRGQMVGVQGRILDAMDDDHITPIEAHRLLCQLQRRLNAGTAGLCRVNKDGDLIAIGLEPHEETDAR